MLDNQLQKLQEILSNKLKIETLTLYGHNRARFLPFYHKLLTASGVATLKMICDQPNVHSEDLMFFQEWKNRNHRFPKINAMELTFWKDNLKLQYETAISLLLDVFPKLTKLTFKSQLPHSADECIEILDIISAFWKKNFLERRKHYINIAAMIPKVSLHLLLNEIIDESFRKS